MPCRHSLEAMVPVMLLNGGDAIKQNVQLILHLFWNTLLLSVLPASFHGIISHGVFVCTVIHLPCFYVLCLHSMGLALSAFETGTFDLWQDQI